MTDFRASFVKFMERAAAQLRRVPFHRIEVRILIGLLILLFAQDALLWMNGSPDHAIFALKLNSRSVSREVDWQLENEVNQQFNTPLYFINNGQKYSVTPAELGPSVNKPLLVKRVLAVGHEGNLFQRIWVQDKALLGLVNLPLSGTISRMKMDDITTQLAAQVALSPTPPTPDFANDPSTILPGKDGAVLDTPRLQAYIASYIFHPPLHPIEVPTIPVRPNYVNKDQELAKIIADAQTYTARPLSIRSGTDILTLSPADLKGMLTVVARSDPSDHTASHLVLRLDSTKLNQRLGIFATTVEGNTGAEFNEDAARIAVYAQFYPNKRKLLDVPTGDNTKLRMQIAGINAASSSRSSGMHSASQTANALAGFGQLFPSNSAQKVVYLTFDDGPNDLYHPIILDILKKYHVHATFFLVGDNAKKYPAIVKRTVDEGNEIGNHTLTHAFLPDLSTAAITNELVTTQTILTAITAQPITLFRPPYGGVNATVTKNSKTNNLKLTLWSVDPKDWAEPTTDVLVHRVIDYAHNGSDILLHSNHLATVNALPRIIEVLQAQGYTFKTL